MAERSPGSAGHVRESSGIPELSVVIVTWNSADEIVPCLESVLRNHSELTVEIFVVDNGSQDGTLDLVQERFPAARLLANHRNVGFAAGCNQGIEATSGTAILLLNPDTIIQENALGEMANYMADQPGVGAVGPRLVNAYGRVQRSCLRFASVSALFAGYLHRGGYLPQSMGIPSPVQALSGAALMVKRQVLEEVGVLDPAFFMYGEDVDWCYRMHQGGWEVHYMPNATVLHLRGQSAGQVPVETYVRRRMGKLRFVRKHRRRWELKIISGLLRLNIRLRRLGTMDGDLREYYGQVLEEYDRQRDTLD